MRCGAVTEQGARRAQVHVGAHPQRAEQRWHYAQPGAWTGIVEHAIAAAAVAAAAALWPDGLPSLRLFRHVYSQIKVAQL